MIFKVWGRFPTMDFVFLVVKVYDDELSNFETDMLASMFTYGGIFGVLITGFAVSLPMFINHRLAVIIFCFLGQTICVFLFALNFKSVIWNNKNSKILNFNIFELYIIMFLDGFFNIAATPLCFEVNFTFQKVNFT